MARLSFTHPEMFQSSDSESGSTTERNGQGFRLFLAEFIPGVGLGLALLLTWNSWTSTGCLVSDCSQVLNSAYSHLAGIPIGVFAGALWLGPRTDESPWLILSFTCGHCWTKLEDLTRLDYQDFQYGPGLIFLANVNNRSLTQHILAAALSSREPPARMLEWLVDLPESLRWQFLRGQTGLLAPALEEAYPDYREFFPEADRLLKAHVDFIEQTQVPMTPFLLTRNARKPEFSVEELFGPTRPSL